MCRNPSNCQNPSFSLTTHQLSSTITRPFSQFLQFSPSKYSSVTPHDCKTPPNPKNPMEEKTHQTNTSTPPSVSTNRRSRPPSPDPEPSSPGASSNSSDLTHHSSLSHGSSPEHDITRPVHSPERYLSHGSSPGQEKTRPGNSPEYFSERSLSHGSSPGHEKTRRGNSPERSPSPVPMANRFSRGETAAATKVDRGGGGEGVYRVEGGGGGVRRSRPSSMLRRGKSEKTVRKVGLGFRVCGLVFCLVSFAVMASDKNKGWALDSFFLYKEFRYSLSVNAIGFVYSFGQASYLAYHLATGEYIYRHPLHYYFDFAMDQILTYLLMSASSSATTRVENWLSNWGQDKFPEIATASVALSYMAFLAFALNSLISGYALCAFKST